MKEIAKKICFLISYLVILVADFNLFLKLVLGGVICISLGTLSYKNKYNPIKITYFATIIFSCLFAIDLVINYLVSDYLQFKNSILLSILLSPFLSGYILLVTYISSFVRNKNKI